MNLGLAGLGRMGGVIADRLLGAGHRLTVWNRSTEKTEAFRARGVAAAETPQALIAANDVVLTMVSGETANTELYAKLGPVSRGRVLVNLSTLAPTSMKALASIVRQNGGRFVEAPVLGTVGPAQSGQLVVLAGGDAATIDGVAPALDCFSRKIVRLGDVGTGSAMKIVHNTLLSLYWRAVGEALGFGAASGLQTADMVAVIGDSFAANLQWPLKVPVLLEQEAPVGYDLQSLASELALVERIFEAASAPHDMLGLARVATEQAVADGWGARDVAALALHLRDSAIHSTCT